MGRETALGKVHTITRSCGEVALRYANQVKLGRCSMESKIRANIAIACSPHCSHVNSVAATPWPQRKYPGVIVMLQTMLMSPDGLHSVPAKQYHGGTDSRMRSRMGEK